VSILLSGTANAVAAFDQFVDPKCLCSEDVMSNRRNPNLKDISLVAAVGIIGDCNSVEEGCDILHRSLMS
jgi:hypothetical protein